jgi:MFS family permease
MRLAERRRARLACLLCTSFATQVAVMLDVAVMDVALPTVGHDLGLEGASITWALNAYVVALGGLLLAGGRLADLIGCRQALRLGGVVFGIAAAGSLLVPSAGWFLAARAVQGAGAAILLPAALTVVSTSAAGVGRRTRALAWWAALAELGAVVGVLLAGLVTQYASWRLVYVADVLTAVAITATASAAPDVPRRRRTPPDLLTVLAATTGLVALIIVVVSSGRGLLQPATLLGAVATATSAWLLRERERRSVAPLVPPGLMRGGAPLAANVALALLSAAAFGMWLLLTLEFQHGRGFGPLLAAAALLPLSAGVIAGTWIGVKAMAAGSPADVAVAGTIVAAVGELLLARSAGGYVAALLLPSTLAAVGMGAATVPLTAVATKQPPLGYEAVVSGVLNTSRQVGGAIGIAALGTVATVFDRHTAFALGATLMLAAAVVSWAGIASHGRRSRAGRSRRHRLSSNRGVQSSL